MEPKIIYERPTIEIQERLHEITEGNDIVISGSKDDG